MKRLFIFSISLLFVFANSSATITPEDCDNIRVDTVWWEGPSLDGYAKMVHLTITNVGTTDIEGTIYTASKLDFIPKEGEEEELSFMLSGSIDVSLMPNETKEYDCRYRPSTKKIAGTDRFVADFCLLVTDDSFDKVLYNAEIEYEQYRRVYAKTSYSISGIDYDMDDGTDYSQTKDCPIVTDETLELGWIYENLEDFTIYDDCRLELYQLERRAGGLYYDYNFVEEYRINNIGSHEVKTGSFVPQSNLERNKYYAIEMVYYITGAALRVYNINNAFVFKLDTPTGIDEIESEDSADKPVYTLGGTRVKDVNNLPKGVYIRDGKKILVR